MDNTPNIIIPALPESLETVPPRDIMITIGQELDALEKNLVNGWDVLYPTLYNFFQRTVSELCIPLNCQQVNWFIIFSGLQSHQTSAHILRDGSKQLHIGVAFIRKSLIDVAPQEAEALYQSFRWTVAHEMGHLSDQNFISYAQSFFVRGVLNNVAQLLFIIGAINLLLPSTTEWINVGPKLCLAGAAFLLLQAIGTVLLFRNFEYSADKAALRALPNLNPDNAATALKIMTSAIHEHALEDQNNKWYVYFGAHSDVIRQSTLYQKIVRSSYFWLHPSIAKRIAHIRKLQADEQQ